MRLKLWKPASEDTFSPSPIHSLPNEVLETIFNHVVEEAPHSEYFYKTDLPAITRACKRWRSITLISPRLWSNLGAISFNFTSSKTQKANQSHRIQLHLERSGTCPISFSFSDHEALESANLTECNKTLHLLTKHSSRWQSVHLTLSSTATALCLQIIKGRVLLLRDLNLSLRGNLEQYQVECFASAPSLRTAKLDAVAFFNPDPRIPLPWAQLVEYEEVRSHELGFNRVLEASGPLTTLSCTVRTSLLSHGSIKHHSLRELTINLLTQSSPLLNISLPSLTKLTINGNPGTQIVLTDVYTLLLKSKCILRSLTLDGRFSSEMELLRILELCTDLRTLCLGQISFSDLQQLAHPRSEHPLLVPHLQEFTLHLSIPADELFLQRPNPMYPALDKFAKSRDEMHQNGVISERLHLTVLFKYHFWWGPHRYIHVLVQLEGFPLTEDGDGTFEPPPESFQHRNLDSRASASAVAVASYDSVCQWGKVLRESERWPGLSPLERIWRWSQFSSSIRQMLNEMEVFPITSSTLIWLYRMDIPRVLDWLSSHSPGSKLLNFANRIRKILDSWKPHLLADAKANRRWAMRGFNSIAYVHANDERRSEDQAWNIVIGFPSKDSPLL